MEACTQLRAILARVERHFGHIRQLFSILEEDVLLVDRAAPMVSGGTLHLTLGLFRGTLQQQAAVLLDHQTRLELLITELKTGSSNSGFVNGLLLSFSRLFAGVQDAAWIDQQEQPEQFTERLVDGYIPQAAGRYLEGEGQWMLGRLTAKVDAWTSMKDRLGGHIRWTTGLWDSVPPGHAFSQPLMLTLHGLKAMLAWVTEQVQLEHAHGELRRIGLSMAGTPGADRVFPMEQMRVQSLMVPFPQPMEAMEE